MTNSFSTDTLVPDQALPKPATANMPAIRPRHPLGGVTRTTHARSTHMRTHAASETHAALGTLGRSEALGVPGTPGTAKPVTAPTPLTSREIDPRISDRSAPASFTRNLGCVPLAEMPPRPGLTRTARMPASRNPLLAARVTSPDRALILSAFEELVANGDRLPASIMDGLCDRASTAIAAGLAEAIASLQATIGRFAGELDANRRTLLQDVALSLRPRHSDMQEAAAALLSPVEILALTRDDDGDDDDRGELPQADGAAGMLIDAFLARTLSFHTEHTMSRELILDLAASVDSAEDTLHIIAAQQIVASLRATGALSSELVDALAAALVAPYALAASRCA